jgi:ASC-1-like (ASCH) protein
MTGQMCFRSGRPLVTAEISVNYKNFEKLEKICSGGEPVRPISLYLKIAKRREIKNGEIIIGNEDFTVDIFDISWRRPLF